MTQPQFLISYKDLELRPCSPYKGLPKRGKFDVIAEIIRVRGRLILAMIWLGQFGIARNCKRPKCVSHFIAATTNGA
jgi:hypothetical protein